MPLEGRRRRHRRPRHGGGHPPASDDRSERRSERASPSLARRLGTPAPGARPLSATRGDAKRLGPCRKVRPLPSRPNTHWPRGPGSAGPGTYPETRDSGPHRPLHARVPGRSARRNRRTGRDAAVLGGLGGGPGGERGNHSAPTAWAAPRRWTRRAQRAPGRAREDPIPTALAEGPTCGDGERVVVRRRPAGRRAQGRKFSQDAAAPGTKVRWRARPWRTRTSERS